MKLALRYIRQTYNRVKEIKKIKLGLPSGLLKDQTEKLFLSAGYDIRINERSYRAYIDDPEIEIFLARGQELTFYTEKGAIDAAISQKVYILDQKVKVVPIASFDYGVNMLGNAKIVLAVPEKSKIKSVKDLAGKKILARVPKIAEEYLKKHNIKAEIEWTDRPSEPKVPLLGDAIIEFTNKGSTLKAFNLRIVDVLMETSPTLFMNEKSYKDKWKREKIENLAILLKGARLAQEMAGLMLHVSGEKMERALKILPSLKKPTVTQLRGRHWFDILAVVDKKEIRTLIPELKKIGCTDIVEFPLNKVII